MADLSLFIPITKVDATQHLVYGVATAEVEDRAGEICDYASTKPHYERWSDEIARSTGGKSLGNLRAMHGSVAAGKVVAITFNDEARQIEICAKVVDDGEWLKVTEGVYTGFSQGGSYDRRWTDADGLTRYTAMPNEISLVDLPCLPQAHFEMIKLDGTRELRAFEPDARLKPRVEELVQELEWLMETISEDLSEGEVSGEVIDEVHDLAASLARLLRSTNGYEDEARNYPRQRTPRVPDGASPSEARNTDERPTTKAHRHDATRDGVQRLHDEAVALGARCASAKLVRGSLEKQFDSLSATLADVLRRVKNIEQQPLPLPLSGAQRSIAKHEDVTREASSASTIETLLADPEALSVLAIKLAQRNGRAPLR